MYKSKIYRPRPIHVSQPEKQLADLPIALASDVMGILCNVMNKIPQHTIQLPILV